MNKPTIFLLVPMLHALAKRSALVVGASVGVAG